MDGCGDYFHFEGPAYFQGLLLLLSGRVYSLKGYPFSSHKPHPSTHDDCLSSLFHPGRTAQRPVSCKPFMFPCKSLVPATGVRGESSTGFFLDPSLHGKWTDPRKLVNIYLRGNHPKSTIPCRSIYNRPMDASWDVELNLPWLFPAVGEVNIRHGTGKAYTRERGSV